MHHENPFTELAPREKPVTPARRRFSHSRDVESRAIRAARFPPTNFCNSTTREHFLRSSLVSRTDAPPKQNIPTEPEPGPFTLMERPVDDTLARIGCPRGIVFEEPRVTVSPERPPDMHLCRGPARVTAGRAGSSSRRLDALPLDLPRRRSKVTKHQVLSVTSPLSGYQPVRRWP